MFLKTKPKKATLNGHLILMEVASMIVNDKNTGFGSGVIRESNSNEMFGDDQIAVSVGHPFIISKSQGHHWFPTLHKVDEQHLLVNIWCSADEINPAGATTAYCWTSDRGRTWAAPFQQGDAGHSWGQLQKGASLWLSYQVMKENDTLCSCRVGRAKDGRTYEWSTGTIDFSPNRIIDWPKGAGSLVFARSVLERADGSLLACMYGRFAGDSCDRSILVQSTDGGTSWKYFSTMAYKSDISGEGLNEPCVVELANGDLFCIMRNRSGRPMWVTRSSDGGKSWAVPKRAPKYAVSVFPDLTLMRNGILACSFGRPGCHLMFSVNGLGDQWTNRTTIFEGSSTCYTEKTLRRLRRHSGGGSRSPAVRL